MDGHKMQSHRCQITHLEIKSDENFEELTRRAAAFFGTAGSSRGISVASKVQRFYFPLECADNAYKD
jgi:hypothetical protein